MPVKRREPKRRRSDQAELAAWGQTFDCGVDFFGELEAIGIKGDALYHDPTRAAAKEAWQKLGDAFLEAWKPTSDNRQPWALEAFGAPQGGAHAS